MSAALVLFSAGQDSATCLAWALSKFDRVETIGFAYGQRHAVEMGQRPILRSAIAGIGPEWAARLGGDVVVDLAGYGALAESALTADRAIEMTESGLPSTFVPGRNLVFLSVAAAHAYRRGADTLIGGMCETDFSGYPDCRRDTIDAMQQALSLGLATPVTVATPLMQLTKAQTWGLAHDLGGASLVDAILEHSHTCYEGDRSLRHAWGYGCGVCPACELRANGWREFGAK
ncbi:7-cyano-7-deazaguanine synthase QueC [Candidatus Viadribacter manganicus]|uniref:7-cyano-7-deazaguanine synthase n=1 Tax=Candidatus Viadribacter manganicus TaxID=1759059 RepID=A0A1B1AGB0_9PROT|nr:7-cyano-7-deazaguanine synthase QueC [Candidatus Viadribacter manganicus]ANP45599.1 7-cyano-7-deazaguanine synthase [Candidatus Viadribacter manganicus]